MVVTKRAGRDKEEKKVNKVRMKLAGSSEDRRRRVSEIKVKFRASFLKYNVLSQ